MYMYKHLILWLLIGSGLLLHVIPDTADGFPWLFAWSFLQAGLMFLFLRTRGDRALGIRELSFYFLITRLPLLASIPIMENDFWRYLWDGHVFASGMNPFSYAPLAPEYNDIDIWFRQRVAYADIGTIYPPFSQFIFGMANFVGGGDLIVLKLFFISFEAIGLLSLWAWLKKTDRSPDVLWLVFHPLFLKEIANSAHLDALAVGTSVLFLVSLRKNWLIATLFLALAVLSKLWALVLTPILFYNTPRKFRLLGALTFCGFIILSYLPFISAGAALWDGTRAFAQYWIFNPGPHKLLLYLVSAKVAKLIGAAAVLAISIYAARRFTPERAAVWSVGSLLMFSPVINSWYVLWVLPFAVMARAWPWLVFGVVVFAGYAWFWEADTAYFFRIAQWLLFGISCLWFLKLKHRSTGVVHA